MDLGLEDNVAVIIGAARGIGRSIAEQFARERAAVVLMDIAEEVVETAGQLAAEGGRTLGVTCDAIDYSAVQAAANSVMTEFGRCDHVVVAAGIGSGKYGFPFWNLEPADWERVWQVNVMSVVHAAHAFAPPMIAARRGTFLFLSSIAGQIGSQTDPPYSAAKAAVINFMQCAAKDLGIYNVRANAISPGMIKTALNRSVWQAWHDGQPEASRLSYDDWAQQKIERLTPLRRWQEPQDIAAAAVFLASHQARNITGQTLNVDGGIVMHS